jgi:hypothetical protein
MTGESLLPRPSKKARLGSPTPTEVGLSLERRLALNDLGGTSCPDNANLKPSWSSTAGPLRLGVLLPLAPIQPKGQICLRSPADGGSYPTAMKMGWDQVVRGLLGRAGGLRTSPISFAFRRTARAVRFKNRPTCACVIPRASASRRKKISARLQPLVGCSWGRRMLAPIADA